MGKRNEEVRERKKNEGKTKGGTGGWEGKEVREKS